MKCSNSEITHKAYNSIAIAGKWGLVISVFLFSLFIGILALGIFNINPLVGIALMILEAPLILGIAIFSLKIAKNEEAKFSDIFTGFDNFAKAILLYLLLLVLIFVGFLLLIIPGIIMAFSYSQAFYLLAEDPNIGVFEALKKSRAMMKGYKWQLFCLYFRFFGWIILSILTLGIGFIWLFPYINISYAKFHLELKNQVKQPAYYSY